MDYTTELLWHRPRQDIQLLLLMKIHGPVDGSVHSSKQSSLLKILAQ